jgi:ribonuclease VapC
VIVVDASALIGMLREEPEMERCIRALEAADTIGMSAATLAEALIVAQHRGLTDALLRLVDLYAIRVIPLDAAGARRVGEAHARWGRGAGTADLNMGDCFAYAAATALGAPLLYVGDDFARTDVRAAA